MVLKNETVDIPEAKVEVVSVKAKAKVKVEKIIEILGIRKNLKDRILVIGYFLIGTNPYYEDQVPILIINIKV